MGVKEAADSCRRRSSGAASAASVVAAAAASGAASGAAAAQEPHWGGAAAALPAQRSGMARLLAVALALVVAAAAVLVGHGDGARRLGGHGEEIVSGDGSPGAPFNRPAEASGDVLALFAAMGKHRAEQLARLGAFEGGAQRLASGTAAGGTVSGHALTSPRIAANAVNALSNCPEFLRQHGAKPFGNVTLLHPCYNEQCAIKHSSEACIGAVFAFCCDEADGACQAVLGADVLALRAQVSCTAQSCTDFMLTSGSSTPPANPEPGRCPFSNRTVCDAPCRDSMWEIQYSWLWGECEMNEHCLKNAVLNYDSSVISARNTLGRVLAGVGNCTTCGGGNPDLTCDPRRLVSALSAVLSVRKCSGDLAKADCGMLDQCLPAVRAALELDTLGEDPSRNPLLACILWQSQLVPSSANSTAHLAALRKAAPDVTLPSPDDASYVRFLPGFVGSCTKDVSVAQTGPWNYSKVCLPGREGHHAQCGVGCCPVVERALAGAHTIGVSDFGEPESATFACGQVLASTGSADRR